MTIEVLEKITIRSPSAFSDDRQLFEQLNYALLGAGHDTIGGEDFFNLMHRLGHKQFKDASGRLIWTGIGLITNREQTFVTSATAWEEVLQHQHPVRFIRTDEPQLYWGDFRVSTTEAMQYNGEALDI